MQELGIPAPAREMGGDMKVFISWSGRRSHAVARALRDWLPDVINAVEPWLSSDIEKGAPSMVEIAKGLKDSSFGIICVTPHNQHRPWINYEAGALSKSVGDDPGRVATLLIDIARPTDVTGPLAQFQATQLELEDFKRLIVSVDGHTDHPREASRVEKLVENLWPGLKNKLDAAVAMTPVQPRKSVTRSETEIMDELLGLARSMSARLDGMEIAHRTFAGLPDPRFLAVQSLMSRFDDERRIRHELVRLVEERYGGARATLGLEVEFTTPSSVRVHVFSQLFPMDRVEDFVREAERRVGLRVSLEADGRAPHGSISIRTDNAAPSGD